jgi:hypothetical protein
MSYFFKERDLNRVIKDGKLVEQIRNKEIVNGNMKTENIIKKGTIDKGKLRKKLISKHVSFSPQKEFIEPSNQNLFIIPNNIDDRTLTPYYPRINITMKRKGKKRKGKKKNMSRKKKN